MATTVAATASACALDPEDDVDRDPFSVELGNKEAPVEGVLPGAANVSSEMATAGVASVCPYPAFNGQPGAYICEYGITTVPNYANQLHEFIVGTNHRVYHDWYNLSTGAGSGWENQGGYATSGVWATWVPGGVLRICVRGYNHSIVYLKDYVPGSGWGGWQNDGNGPHCPPIPF
jgi:hypothetical protein